MSRFQPVSARSGVIMSDSVINTSPINPVVRIAKFTLFTQSWWRYASHTSIAPGTAPFTMTSRLAKRVSSRRSEVDIEIHARVQARDLVGVAVEHERLPPTRLADPLLRRLAPPRVIVARIDVGEEPVLVWRADVPRGRRLHRGERHFHDRLDALE